METAFEVTGHLLSAGGISFCGFLQSPAVCRCLFADVLVFFQSIRSKMSIRAEDKPRAFETQFLSSSGAVSKYGDFDFKPGVIVRTETRWKQPIKC